MKRDKVWWSRLDADERSMLVYMERSQVTHGDAYLPDDCSECVCGTPTMGGWCKQCSDDYDALVRKADGR